LKKSTLDEEEFPSELEEKEYVHIPFIAPVNSNFKILCVEDTESPNLNEFKTIR
jgi:hypothetical protein